MCKRIGLFLSVSLSIFIASCGNDNTSEQQTKQQVEQPAEQQVEQPAEQQVKQPAEQQVEKTPTEKVVKPPTYVTIPQNTPISITLVDSIDTDVHLSGAEFRARLSKPIVVDGRTLFAAGAGAKGILNTVVESGHLKTPAELHFSLTAIQDGSGHWVSVGTTTIVEKKDSHTAREVAMIGGGAVVGGIIGKVIDKKGSTEIGAAAGAAAGTGLAAATGKQDIFHAAGTEVVFYSSQPTQITVK